MLQVTEDKKLSWCWQTRATQWYIYSCVSRVVLHHNFPLATFSTGFSGHRW